MRNISYDSVENTLTISAHEKKFLSRYWERQFSWLVSSFSWKEDLHSSLARDSEGFYLRIQIHSKAGRIILSWKENWTEMCFFHKSLVKKYLIFPLCVFPPNGRYISMKHSLCLHTHTHTHTHTNTHTHSYI